MATTTPSPTGVISFYDLAYLPMKRCLESAIAITKKAQNHLSTTANTATATEEADLVNTRLAPDMYPFWEQCYLLQKTTSQIIQRLTAPTPSSSTSPTLTVIDPPRPASDSITTLHQCIALLQSSLDELTQGLAQNAFTDAQAGVETSVTYGPVTLPVSKRGYLEGMTLPNMYFHLSIAYAILRMKGVPLGKADYMTPFFVDYVDRDVLGRLMAARAGGGAGGAGADGAQGGEKEGKDETEKA